MTVRGALRELIRREGRTLEATRSRAAAPTVPERSGFEAGIPRGGLNEVNAGLGASTGSDRRSSMVDLYDVFMTCPWSYAAVNAIARTITAGGLVVDWDGDDGEGDRAQPAKPDNVLAMERLFAFCNPREDIRQILRGVITDLLVFGDAYLEVTWLAGIPVALYSLDATTMFPRADEHGTISKYVQLTDTGQRAEFEPEEVIHVSLDSPRSGVFGASPTQANLLPIMAWLFAAATLKETYRKGNPPSLHVDFPASLSDASVERWDQQYRTRNIGPRNIGTPVETKGGATVTELSVRSIADGMAFLDQKRDEILAGYGVPPAQAGVIESGNLGGGTGESQRKTFQTNTCQPIAELVLEKIQYAIAKVGFGIAGWHLKFADIDMRDSLVVEQIRDMRLRNGSYTENRYRAEIGEPPVPGGDEAVIIDRQNMVLVRDLEAASRAGIAAKLKGSALEPDSPASGQSMTLSRPDPAALAGTAAPTPGPGKGAKGGKGRVADDPGESIAAEWAALSEQWTALYARRRRRALDELPHVGEHKGHDGDGPHDHDHHDGPDYTPAELGLAEPLGTVRVDPRDVHVDHSYQRALVPSHVEALAALPRHVLAHRVGLLARRPDGSLWVVDGQHHTAAAVKDGIMWMTYRVFDSTGPAMERRVYAAWQRWDRADRDLPDKTPAALARL